MNTYHLTPAECSDAEYFFGQSDALGHDYCTDHADKEKLPKIAPCIGKVPTAAAEAIALGQDIRLPIHGINDPLTSRGMTLLHLTALLYSRSARSYATGSRERAQYYERVCRLLLDGGADPQARMSTDGFFTDMHTPAAVCDGYQPLCLRARMLREAAEGRCETKHKAMSYIQSRRGRGTSEAIKIRLRPARGITDTGKGWRVEAQDGVTVRVVAYDPASKTDRYTKHRVAILTREQYEHAKGFSNARRRRA